MTARAKWTAHVALAACAGIIIGTRCAPAPPRPDPFVDQVARQRIEALRKARAEDARAVLDATERMIDRHGRELHELVRRIDDVRCALEHHADRSRRPIAKHAWSDAWDPRARCERCRYGYACNVQQEPTP